jgi:arylsulfatase
MPKLHSIAAVIFLVMLSCSAATAIKPNVVLVFMDNFGWGEPGFNGGGIIRGAPTPRLDQFAAEGPRLTNFNVEVQCTPSRSAIMTGRYAIRSGNGTVPLGEGVYGLVQWEVTMAEMLSDAGYATAMYGKWHLGRTEGRFTTDQGLDEWYGVPNSSDESIWTTSPYFREGTHPAAIYEHIFDGRKGSAPKKVKVYAAKARLEMDGELTAKAKDVNRAQDSLSSSRREDRAGDAHDRRRRTVRQA